jgi:very-short-patch-repair endonuclease
MTKPVKKVALARQMRRKLTEPELILWFRLKDRTDGLTFRNQHPIGPYIADFYCAKAKLIIEIDGALHMSGERAERDAARDQYFTAKGYMTYRIPAEDVYRDADSVADGIKLLAEERIKEK